MYIANGSWVIALRVLVARRSAHIRFTFTLELFRSNQHLTDLVQNTSVLHIKRKIDPLKPPNLILHIIQIVSLCSL